MSVCKENKFEDRDALALALSGDVTCALLAGFKQRQSVSLVVSGGSTPMPFFKALSQEPLNWGRVHVTLADERWVAEDHEHSNARLVRHNLVKDTGMTFHSLKTAHDSPEAGVDTLSAGFNQSVPMPFEVVVLGMGGDGHTASLFPNEANLGAGIDLENSDLFIAANPGVSPYPRISMTLSALLQSKHIFLHITGKDKWDVYRKALKTKDYKQYPIAAVLSQTHVPVTVYWSE